MFISMVRVNAATTTKDVPAYGTVTIDETEWQSDNNGGYTINQTYYVTKTNNGYVYLKLIETDNVEVDDNVITSSAFDLLYKYDTENGVAFLFKAKGNVTSKTEVFTVVARIVDPNVKRCNLSYAPQNIPTCGVVGNLYFDRNGNNVSEAEYRSSCEGYTAPEPGTDLPNTPDTGSVVPYVAIGGGLVAIGAVYAYSRKKNKVYKI